MQTVFQWFEDGLNRSVVRSLCVWKPESKGGEQRDIGLVTWLRWFTPLGHSAEAQAVG